MDDPENSINWKLTKRPIMFNYAIYWQHPAPILRVWPLAIINGQTLQSL
jgi:hypothetical protein